jgi:cyclopropane fatty-acyl-phospholipid synthase-like methyltransferase
MSLGSRLPGSDRIWHHSSVKRLPLSEFDLRLSRACYHHEMDPSTGYEAISAEFLARRGSDETRANAIGVKEVQRWAKTLPRGSSVIDLGCGPGFPLTIVLIEEGLNVFAVDGSPSLVSAFQRNLPGIPIACESVLDSSFFGRAFDAVLSIGLMFLLRVEDQHRLIRRFAGVLVPGGRLLFTSTAKPHLWTDAMTGLESISLGAGEYRRLLANAGIAVTDEYEDIGGNHYFDASKEKS